jgi:type I restriction enzyme, S subunit
MNNLIEYKSFGYLLNNIVDNRGKTCPTSDQGIPLIATNCIVNTNLFPKYEKVRYVDEYTFNTWFRDHPKPGDMIFVLKGTPGRIAWVPDPVDFCIAQDMVAIRADKNKIYPKYLFAVLRSDSIQQEIEGLHVGSLIPHFKKSDFDDLKIPIVEPNLQEYIGDQYFNISLKIDLLHRENKTLETMAETLFRQWFVEEAEEGWESVKIGDFVQTNALSIDNNFDHNIIRYLDTGSLTEGRIESFQTFDIADAPSRARRIVKHNDILISTVRPNQKHYGIIKRPDKDMIFSTGFCVITCDKISPYFIYILLTTDDMTEYLHSIAEGSTSTYPSLKPSDIEKIEFQLPPKEKLNLFSIFAENTWDKIECNHNNIKILVELRDTLLPKLMSGEVIIK